MVNFLVRIFIKSDDFKNEKVREKAGVLSSITGICLNIILFTIKFIMGTISGSIAIISDGFNNLSDSASCIITLFGYKMAAKPADKDHPFGHGRIEYLTSLMIAAIIILVGFELFKESINKIINPVELHFEWIVLISLVVSILVKLWMSHFNKVLGNRCNSSIMLATSKDSLNDVVATTVTVISLILSQFTALPVDGFMGVVVSLFVLLAGYEIVKDTVDELLGKPLPEDEMEELMNFIDKYEVVLGVHDVIIHNYGPSKQIGSCHVEVSSSGNVLEIHDAIDTIERDIYNEFKIMMTIHMDPIEENDEERNKCKMLITDILNELDPELKFHDLRIVKGPTHTNIIFDIVLPYDYKYSKDYIQKYIGSKLANEDETYYTVITYDNKY